MPEKHLDDILDQSAQEIISKGKKVAVLYSGGVDSTCVVCGLIRNGIPSNMLEIRGTKESIDEYPTFPDILARLGYRQCLNIVEWKDLIPTDPNVDIYSGKRGKLLYSHFATKYPQFVDRDWIEYAKFRLGDRFNRYKESIAIVNDYFARTFPYPIKTFNHINIIFDLCFGIETHPNELRYAKNPLNAFFTYPDIDHWVLHKFYDPMGPCAVYTPLTYKYRIKEYIYTVTKDSEYFYKDNVYSWKGVTKRYDSIFNVLDTEGVKNFGSCPVERRYDILARYYHK